MSSFFRRVTRFPLGSALDPRENRLTEITAAVFDEVPGFARDVAALLLAEDSGPEAAGKPNHPRFSALNLRVRTQKTTFTQKFVDLEVRLSPAPFAGGDTQLLWVEVKHGAGIHGSQLRDYLDDIERESADVRRVVILAPRNAMPPPADVPREISVVEWQAVGRVLDRWRRRDHEPLQRFLLDQYAAYLLEEGLMDEGRLTAEHAFVLSAQPATGDVAALLCELADAHVQTHWGPRGDHAKRGGKPAFGIDYWAHYPRHAAGSAPAPDTWGDSTFEWSLRTDTHREEPRNAYVFTAGLTVLRVKRNPITAPGNEEWFAARRADEFEYLSDWYWRLWRVRYPEELLSARSIDDQAAALGDWIVLSFEALANNPPDSRSIE